MAESDPPHPYAHVPDEKCYEWMIAQCSALEAARQAREDGLIATVTQISSASLLLVPGFLLGSDQRAPAFAEVPAFYISIVYFLIALLSALMEQYLSGKANENQIKITQAFYRKESATSYDDQYVARVRLARSLAYGFFVLAVIGMAVSFLQMS